MSTPANIQTASEPAVACTALLGRAELPERFEVIVRKRDMAIADNETKATAHGIWLRAKNELIGRGYMVWEYWDEERKAYVASCTKRPNAQRERWGPAAGDAGIASNLNGWPPSAPRCGSPIVTEKHSGRHSCFQLPFPAAFPGL